MSADEVVAAHFPIVSISIISGIAVGVGGIFFKLREIGKDNRKDLQASIEIKVHTEEVFNKLRFHIEEQDRKIKRLEDIIFKLPNGTK